MHTDEAVRPLRGRCKRSHRNGRSICGENRFRPQQPIRLAQDLALELELFGECFNHKIGGRNCFHFCRRVDAGQNRRLFALGYLAFSNFAIEILRDRFQSTVEKALLNVAQDHSIAAAREDVGDTVAHRTSTENRQGTNRIRIQRLLHLGVKVQQNHGRSGKIKPTCSD